MTEKRRWIDNKFIMFWWCVLLAVLGVVYLLRPIRVTILAVICSLIVVLFLRVII